MALVQSTFSRVWEDSCRLCCLVILASGRWSNLPPCHCEIQTEPRQQHKDWPPVFFLEFKRNVWPFRHFYPMAYPSSAFMAWATWAARWTGCWGKMMFLSSWGNKQKTVLAMWNHVIYRLSWTDQEPKSPSHQVTHKQRQNNRKIYFLKIIFFNIIVVVTLLIYLYSSIFSGQPVTIPREPGCICKVASIPTCWPFWRSNHDHSNHLIYPELTIRWVSHFNCISKMLWNYMLPFTWANHELNCLKWLTIEQNMNNFYC